MRVESIGKLHYRNETDPTGFDRQHEPLHILDGIGQLWGSVRDPMPAKAGRSALYDKVGPGTSPYNRYDERITELAEQWLTQRAARPDTKPWLLMVGLVAPHMPLVVPLQYLDLYPPERMPMPKLLPRDGYLRHPWVERKAGFWDHDATFDSDARRRLAIACYFGLITFLDERIGRILDALEHTGLAATTRVIYSTDHGDNLGTRGLWNKDTLYREGTAVPLIMAGAGVPQGAVCRTNASLVDLYPTFLDAMGVPGTPQERAPPGRSLFDLAAAPDDPGRAVLSEYHTVGAAGGAFLFARGRYKYHHYYRFCRSRCSRKCPSIKRLPKASTRPSMSCSVTN